MDGLIRATQDGDDVWIVVEKISAFKYEEDKDLTLIFCTGENTPWVVDGNLTEKLIARANHRFY